jgi:hypothetical protein
MGAVVVLTACGFGRWRWDCLDLLLGGNGDLLAGAGQRVVAAGLQ